MVFVRLLLAEGNQHVPFPRCGRAVTSIFRSVGVRLAPCGCTCRSEEAYGYDLDNKVAINRDLAAQHDAAPEGLAASPPSAAEHTMVPLTPEEWLRSRAELMERLGEQPGV